MPAKEPYTKALCSAGVHSFDAHLPGLMWLLYFCAATHGWPTVSADIYELLSEKSRC